MSVLLLGPIALTRFPPLYDYYHWTYQGHLLARLAFWNAAGDPASTFYSIDWGPIPNLGALVGIGALNSPLSPAVAGRVFLGVSVASFSWAFACLARSVQQRPTAAEFLGYPFAYGYLVYKGYLSNQLGLALAMFTIAWLHRRIARETFRLRDASVLAGLGLLVYLCHLFAWLTLALAIAVYALLLVRRRRAGGGLALASTLTPSLLMFAWYVQVRTGQVRPTLYDAFEKKFLALTGPLMPILRTDPFPSPLPVFWVNLLVGVGLVVAILANRNGRANGPTARPIIVLAALLAIAAVFEPFGELGGGKRPDERLILPALLFFLAATRIDAFRLPRGLFGPVIAALVLLFHSVEYRQAGTELEGIHTRIAAAVPPEAATLSLTVWDGRLDGGCRAEPGFSFGTPVTKWLDQQRLLGFAGARSRIMRTSVLTYHPASGRQPTHWAQVGSMEWIADRLEVRDYFKNFDVVLMLGCPQQLAELRPRVRKGTVIAEGTWFVAFQGRKPPLLPGVWDTR